jgi:hypothetical protein
MTDNENLSSLRDRVCANLAAFGAAVAEIEYDGEHDAGCITSVQLLDAARQQIDLPTSTVELTYETSYWDADAKAWRKRSQSQTVPIDEALKQWCYDLLEEHFDGWEIDDGANGTITLDIIARTGLIEHRARVIDYCCDSVEV